MRMSSIHYLKGRWNCAICSSPITDPIPLTHSINDIHGYLVSIKRKKKVAKCIVLLI